MTTEMVRYAERLLRREWVKEEVIKSRKTMTPSELAWMVEQLRASASKPDANNFCILVKLASDRIREGRPIPKLLSNFAADVLEGIVKRPGRRAEDPEKAVRDYGFWRTSLKVARRYRLPLYTNNELSKKTTAAEIVRQAAGCKVDVVVRAIKKNQRGFTSAVPSPNT